jgi:hypothetical protein
MCPLAAQPDRIPYVDHNICMGGSFLGPPMCTHSSGSAAGQNATGWL